jgi:hypothetical protein
MTKNKITTIEGLAEKIQRIMARKEDVQALDKKVQALDMKVTTGFDRIEHLLLKEQKRKIENLETRMKKLEDALAIQHKIQRSKPPFPGGLCVLNPHSNHRITPHHFCPGVPILGTYSASSPSALLPPRSRYLSVSIFGTSRTILVDSSRQPPYTCVGSSFRVAYLNSSERYTR